MGDGTVGARVWYNKDCEDDRNGNVPLVESNILVDGGKFFVIGGGGDDDDDDDEDCCGSSTGSNDDDDKTCFLE
jgi:hypothetical protein